MARREPRRRNASRSMDDLARNIKVLVKKATHSADVFGQSRNHFLTAIGNAFLRMGTRGRPDLTDIWYLSQIKVPYDPKEWIGWDGEDFVLVGNYLLAIVSRSQQEGYEDYADTHLLGKCHYCNKIATKTRPLYQKGRLIGFADACEDHAGRA